MGGSWDARDTVPPACAQQALRAEEWGLEMRAVPRGGEEGELRAWAGAAWAAWLVDPLPPPSRAFLEYYQQHLEYACPTEDIYLE